jgi:lipopolysaccharide transport system permease protein
MLSIDALKAVWSFRGFILANVARELRVRVAATQLGPLWIVIQPALTIAIYTLIFSRIMPTRLPGTHDAYAYAIYLTAGILMWNLFTTIVTRGTGMFVANASYIKHFHFPKVCLPIITIGYSLVDFAFLLLFFGAGLAALGRFPGWTMLAVLPVTLVLLVLAIALAVLLGTINVFYRDVEQVLPNVLQLLFWLTPIVYVPDVLPEAAQAVMRVNPLWPVVAGFHSILYRQAMPDWATLAYPLAVALALAALAAFAFRKLRNDMVEVL